MMLPTDHAADIRSASARLTAWCRDKALPLWAGAARTEKGGFYEQLTMDASPDRDCPVRVRVVARLVYAFAHAGYLGWHGKAGAIADAGKEFLLAHGIMHDADGAFAGMAYLMTPDGTVTEARIDLYSQAFLLLAMAWHYRATGDASSIALAEEAMAFLDKQMGSPAGGWIEGLPAGDTPRRQNPHMHLFEAFMALYQATNDAAWLEKADHVYGIFEKKFFDPQEGVLLEFFTDDWTPDPATGDLIEPGHMLEWCWLLSVYGALRDIDLSSPMRRLYDEAMKRGMNAATGLVWDEMKLSGEVTKPTHRSWSLTEFLKASIALARQGDADAASRVAPLTDKLMETYLATPVEGGWFDQYDAAGAVISDTMPTSTFYHIVCAVAELDALAADLPAG